MAAPGAWPLRRSRSTALACSTESEPKRSLRLCEGASWWNGWRVTRPVVVSSTGDVERREVPLPRSKCGTCKVSATCYPHRFYPRRQYQLDVVATAAAVEVGSETAVAAAAAVSASPGSMSRWRRWVGAVADVVALHAVAAHVDPTTAPVATATPRSPTAAVLAALEVLGDALVRAGVAVVERTGLGRVLGWQHRAHGVVLGVVAGPTRFSPAMAHGGRPASRSVLAPGPMIATTIPRSLARWSAIA